MRLVCGYPAVECLSGCLPVLVCCVDFQCGTRYFRTCGHILLADSQGGRGVCDVKSLDGGKPSCRYVFLYGVDDLFSAVTETVQVLSFPVLCEGVLPLCLCCDCGGVDLGSVCEQMDGDALRTYFCILVVPELVHSDLCGFRRVAVSYRVTGFLVSCNNCGIACDGIFCHGVLNELSCGSVLWQLRLAAVGLKGDVPAVGIGQDSGIDFLSVRKQVYGDAFRTDTVTVASVTPCLFDRNGYIRTEGVLNHKSCHIAAV